MESVPPACDRGANSKEVLKVSRTRQEKTDFQSSQTAWNPAYPDEPPSGTSFRNYTGTSCIYLKALIRQRIALGKGSIPPTILEKTNSISQNPFPNWIKMGKLKQLSPGDHNCETSNITNPLARNPRDWSQGLQPNSEQQKVRNSAAY